MEPNKIHYDIYTVLYCVQSLSRRYNIGLGTQEIHPLAFHLQRTTDDEIFGKATFRTWNRGVRSPEIRQALEDMVEDGMGTELNQDEKGAPETDTYYLLGEYDKFDIARERLDELPEDVQQKLDAAVETLVRERLRFITHENARMVDQVTPHKVTLPEPPEYRTN